MDEGYIKLYRRTIDSSIFAHPIGLKIWVWCLIKATYKVRHVSLKVGKGFTTVAIQEGQFIFGRFKAEEELGIDGSTIYKWMQKLKEMEMIEIDSNNQYSIITICNWADYQGNGVGDVTTKEQPSNNHVTTEEHPSNTYKNVKKDKNVKKTINIIPQEIFDLNEWAKGYFHEKFINEKSLDCFDKLIKLDKYSVEEVKMAISWARNDQFWCSNFLTPVKLRSKNKDGVKYIDVFLVKIQSNGRNYATSDAELAGLIAKHFA